MTTYRELKTMIGIPEGRLPKVNTVAAMNDVLLVFAEGDIKIEVHKCGYIRYMRDGHSTVFTLKYCKLIPTETTEMNEANRKAYEEQGFQVISRKMNGCRQDVVCLTDDIFLDLDWTLPLLYVGEDRLIHNSDIREKYRSSFSINGDGTDWNKHLWVPDFTEQNECQEEETKQSIDEKMRLNAAIKMLTDHQQEVIKKYYYEGKTQRMIAVELGISQQAISKTIRLSLKNLRKNMEKMEREDVEKKDKER